MSQKKIKIGWAQVADSNGEYFPIHINYVGEKQVLADVYLNGKEAQPTRTMALFSMDRIMPDRRYCLNTEMLTFRQFQNINFLRSEERTECQKWSTADWVMALMGEMGEMCNILKKINRGDLDPLDEGVRQDIKDEMADTFTYLFLLSSELGIDVESAIVHKFNVISDRIGSDFKINID